MRIVLLLALVCLSVLIALPVAQAALKQRRLTLKEWFLNNGQEDLLSKMELLEKEKKRDK